MKTKTEKKRQGINALSFEKLLSMSDILQSGVRYGKHCKLVEVSTDSVRDIFKHPVRIDAYVFVVCSDGLIEITCNLYSITLESNSMFLYNSGNLLRINAIGPSRVSMMIFTREFIDELGIKIENLPLLYKLLRQRQKFALSPGECSQLRGMMTTTAELIGLNQYNEHYGEMVKSSFKTLIHRALHIVNEQYESSSEATPPALENNHFDKFMRLLQKHYKREHSIRFYSGRMNLSPKYLSLLIKNVSGKLATEWIDDYIILEAKNMIKYSSMSIQEISYSLNFPNQSFFGKYFKRHTGLSPKAYRLQP